MRVLVFANNWVGWQVSKWLKDRGEEIVGVIIHPPGRRKYADEIIQSADVRPSTVFDGSRLRQAEVLQAISALRPEIGVSALFGYILRAPLLDLLPAGCVNVHPALLPYNRGAFPNVWSIIDGTPAGATVHYIDTGVDTGDIIAQRAVPVTPVDTGGSLYRKLERACLDVFAEAWPLIRTGRAPRHPQAVEGGTFHRLRDVERVDEIELDRTYTARELIDVIRARTFPPHRGAYFKVNGRRVHLCLQLFFEDDRDREG
jgi:methionyl-tRNA formyltransferase